MIDTGTDRAAQYKVDGITGILLYAARFFTSYKGLDSGKVLPSAGKVADFVNELVTVCI